MSLILEALKKAQRDRELRQAQDAMFPRDATPRNSRPMASWAVIAGAVLLFASGGVVTWWWGRAASPLPAPASPVEISRPAPTPEVSDQGPKPALVPPGPSPAAPAREEEEQLAPPSIRLTPPAKPRPPGPVGTGDMAGSPAASASVRRPSAAARSAALVPLPRAEPKPAPSASPSLAEVISTLTLNALVYSDVKKERIVYIDGRRYVEGERVNGLYLLEEITPQGVLLSYQGERGLLSTPLGRVAR
jgi:general secretion pathway protein B